MYQLAASAILWRGVLRLIAVKVAAAGSGQTGGRQWEESLMRTTTTVNTVMPAALGPVTVQWREQLSDGTSVLIRPISSADAQRERDFIDNLSIESRYFRFLDGMRCPSPELIERLTGVDQIRDVAFVALVEDPAAADGIRQVGVCRYSGNPDGRSSEFAVAVADAYQHRGLGTLLMRHLIDVARARGIKCLYSLDAADNGSMRELAAHMGWQRKMHEDDASLVSHIINL
jgi:GNAT superfamily N-acetyltransferase